MLFIKIITLIAGFESFTHVPIKDRTQMSVGYGTKAVLKDVCITKAWGEKRLSEIVTKHLKVVRQAKLTENQTIALTSFSYNVGKNAYRNSTLAKLARSGAICQAAKEFDKWIYVSGQPSNGLIERRTKEKEIFLRGTSC